jgi:hypothetical protein
MPMTLLRSTLAAAVTFVLPTAFGCTSASGPSLDPHKSNCSVVCDKVQGCIDKDIDTDKCVDDCDDKSDDDDVFAAKVKECAECTEPKACTETSVCVDDCLRIFMP